MSMCVCAQCDRTFDSDDDPGCFIEVGNTTETWCLWCRIDRDDEDLRYHYETEMSKKDV